MTQWVSMVETGRGPGSAEIQIPAGNGRDAWSLQTSLTPAIAEVDSADDWIVTRFSAALAWLNRWPEPDSGELTRFTNGERDRGAGHFDTLNIALVATAHWGLETGWGTREYNWNLGGIHCGNSEGNCFRESEQTGGEAFLAYDSFAEFARDYFELVSRQNRYASAWAAAKTGSANFILRLWQNNYSCGARSPAEATALVARVRRVIDARTNADAALPSVTQIRATDNAVPNRCRPRSDNRGNGNGGNGNGGGSRRSKGVLWAAGALAVLALMKGDS